MMGVIWTSLASTLFFVNFINILKNIKDDKSTASETFLGCILIIFIVLGIASFH